MKKLKQFKVVDEVRFDMNTKAIYIRTVGITEFSLWVALVIDHPLFEQNWKTRMDKLKKLGYQEFAGE